MSRLSRALNVSLRPSQCSLKGSVLAPPRTQPVRKRDIHIKSRARHDFRQSTKVTGSQWRQTHSEASSEAAPSGSTTGNYGSPHATESNFSFAEDGARMAAHLNSVFHSLEFPPELAQRVLTHGSHKAAIHGHNARLGFVGRRALESYFLLFIHGVPQTRSHHDYDVLVSRALNTYILGEHVALQWSLGRVLRWVPTVSQETLRTAQQQRPDAELEEALAANPGIVRSVGLYKVLGEAVQAVVGGVYHQFGGSVAHRLFHTRILPHILLPESAGGVPAEFHAKALSICESMGGMEGDLLYRTKPSAAPAEHQHREQVERKPKRAAAVGL
ncbi:hypothetical protein HYDPIDRAFT_112748 [Hydnomerulius pinastri MD-312]|uniref:RNase III domain-containing protein n=1 Tax=Hydnomerulius pinastri MD-312 TaxID=994086 RepID=A0A0C9VE34_9AGAM|nr:hypothetical protein HYDPIDRAFT_112748 [Hydnomerulius pinastri MD-312]